MGVWCIKAHYRISWLEVFDSAARADNVNPTSSDADFLVEFAPDAVPSLEAFFGAKADLEQLLGRCVDLVEPAAVRNPYVLANINRNHEAVYAADGENRTCEKLQIQWALPLSFATLLIAEYAY